MNSTIIGIIVATIGYICGWFAARLSAKVTGAHGTFTYITGTDEEGPAIGICFTTPVDNDTSTITLTKSR